MKRTRASNLNASRRYSGRKQKRQNRSSGPSSSDYNLLEPRLLLVNYHFGDAPEPYPVTLADHPDVARHGTGTDSYGSTSDGEHTDYADSSGVPFVATSIVSPGGTAFVADAYASVHTWKFDWDPNETYYVDGWVDWNQDGDWLDSGEQVLKRVPYNPFYYFRGFGDGHFPVPEDAALGGTFGRFRISSTGNLGPHTGLAADGLMDDVFFHVVQPDFQNPDSNGFAGLGDLKWVDADMGGSNSPVPIPKLADFNQDGATDIADWSGFTPYPTGAWIEGAFSQAFSGALSEYNRVGDINGDGMPDLVETEWLDGTYNGTPLNGQGAAVSSLNGSAVVGWANYISPRIVGYRFGVVDYDGDGRDDLVAETKNSEGISDGIYWLGGQSDFSLTLPTQADSVFQAAPYAQADIDGDGDVDLISHEAVYLRSNGTNFNRIALASAIDNYKGSEVLTTDLDQDGRREIIGVTGGWSNSNLTIQEFTGSGFTTVYTRPTRSRSSIIVTDLDNDSHNEIIVDGTGNHQISVLQFDGNFVANVQTYNHTDTDLGLRVVGSGDVGRNWATEYPSGTDFIAIPIETISPTEHAFTIMGALFYEVTPAPENNPPTVDPISDRTIQENVSWQTVTLTGITDGDADYNQPLRVTASSSNPGLIPNSENYLSVDYDSPDTTGDLRFKPVADETGSVVITVTVEDGGLDNNLETSGDNLTFSRSFTVTVNAGNNPPTLDSIADRTIDEDAAEQTVTLTGITDGDAEYNQPLRVTATSNNLGLISNPTVVYQSPNSTGSLKFTPVPDQYGSALITVTVEDGGDDNDLGTSGDNLTFSQTFTVTVNPVNDAPLLDPISDRSVQKNASQQTVGLTGIRAGGGESQPLSVTASSNNTNLIPTPEVDYTSANSTGNLRFTPAANQTGSAVITVEVEDGGLDNDLNTTDDNLTFSRSFTVTVDGVNFFTNGSQLLLELNNANQQITATSHGSSYTLTMSGGQWFGTDNSYVSGSGTNQLTVTNAGRSQFNEIRVDDNAVGGSFTFGDSGNNAYTEQFMILLDRMDAGNVSFTGDTRFTGNAGLTATTTLSISLSESGTRLETFDGDIVFSANRQATPRSFETDGVTLFESTIIATGLGNITLSGRGGYSEVNGNCGIDLLHGSATTSIVTNNGNLTIDGIGGGAGQSLNNIGVHVGSYGSIASIGSGQVTIHGTGGVGSGNNNYGVYVVNTNSTITSNGGNVSVTGQGGGSGSSANNIGALVEYGGLISSGGSGDVVVNGVGGAGSGNDNMGVVVRYLSEDDLRSTIRSAGGDVRIEGTGGGTGASGWNRGVAIHVGGLVSAGGSGNVTVIGTSGVADGPFNLGVSVIGKTSPAGITSSGGNVLVRGTGNGSSTSEYNRGVEVLRGAVISAGQDGAVTIEGTGGNSGIGNDYGVLVWGTSDTGDPSTITSSGGNVSVTGQGGGTGSSANNIGTLIENGGLVSSGGSGDVVVTGTGGATSGNANQGVLIRGLSESGLRSTITSAGGDVTVQGTGRGTNDSEYNGGVAIHNGGLVTAGSTGNVLVKGTGGSSDGRFNNGVAVNGQTAAGQITSSGGHVVVQGKGNGSELSRYNYGINVFWGGEINAAGDGTVTVEGTGGNSGIGNDYGVLVWGTSDAGDPSTITSSGGNVSVTGQGGGTGSSANNIGTLIQNGGLVSSGGSGDVVVTGTGGQGTGGTESSSNYGVSVLDGGIITSPGNIRVVGVSGNSSGAQNIGVNIKGYSADADVISTGGSIQIDGTAGGTEASTNGIGVRISAGSRVAVTAGSGSLSITGTGAKTGGIYNIGVVVDGYDYSSETTVGAIVATSGGPITIEGVGGGLDTGSSHDNEGIKIQNLGQIIGANGATVLLSGQGGVGAYDLSGVLLQASGLIDGGEVIIVGSGTDQEPGLWCRSADSQIKASNEILIDAQIRLDALDLDFSAPVLAWGGGLWVAAIKGTVAEADYDQLDIEGSVELGPINLAGSYVPQPGDTFILIDNDGSDPISGRWFYDNRWIDEGDAVPFNGVELSVSYMGGDGNDFVLTTIEPGNNPPGIDSLDDITIEEDADEQLVALSGIDDGDGGNQPLSVTASSNNTSLIPTPTVDYTSPHSTGTARFTPVSDQFGTAIITVTVEDGGDDNDLDTTDDNLSTSRTFTVTVDPVNDTPLLDPIDDVTIDEDSLEHSVNLTGIFAGPGGESQNLRVAASSNNTNLIPTPTVDYDSPNSTGSIQFTPLADQYGTAVITVTVEDGGDDNDLNTSGDNLTTSRTFTVTVNPVNDTPLLDPIADRTHDKNSDEQTVNLTGIDAGGGESQPLHVTSSSNNTSLIPTPTVDYDTPNSTGSLRYTPVADQIGTAIITVRVEDGGLDGDLNTTGDNATVSRTFVVSVVEPTNLDFGDSPSPYPVTLSEDGARHEATGPTLGQSRDSEADGTHSVLADADGADEDGILFGLLHPGQLNSTVIVNVQNAPDGAVLDGWIDFNADKNWGGIDERIFANQVVAEGDNILKFDVPSATPSKSLVARFRLSTSGIDTVTGYANDGEVEDFLVTVSPPVKSTLEFSSPTSLLSSGTRITRSVDIDGDGDIDFFGSLSSGNGYWAEQTEAGTFVSHPLDYEIVDAVDIDFDNDIDFLAISDTKNDLLLLKNQGDQTLIVESLGVNLTGASYGSFDGNGEGRVADVDGDGDLDIAITVSPDSGTDQLHLIEQTSTGWTSHIASTNGGGALYDSHFADLDNDGDLDISYATYDGPSVGRVGWYRNDGNWSFTELNWTTDWGQATGAFPVDFDEDGNMDVLATGPSDLDEEIELFQNNGDATFTQIIPQSEITPHTFGANSVFPADLSGDGNFDIVWGDWWGRTVGWIPHSTSSPYSVVKLHTFGTAGNFVWADDVNNDGAMDILVANYHSSGSNGSVFLISNTGYVTLDAVHDVVMRTASIDVGLTGISSNRDGGSTLRITASSSNPALVDATVDYTSPNSKGNLHLVRKSVVEGVVLITVMVEDAGADGNLATTEDNVTFRRDFAVSVQSQSFPPTLDPISDRTLQEDTDEQSVSLSGITDGDTGNQLLRVTASSNNTSLIPTPTVDYNSPDSTGTVRFTPLPDQFGTANITVTVEDGGNDNDLSTTDDNLRFSRSFTVTVNPVNDRPVLDETASPSLGDIVQDSPVPTGPVGTLVSDLIDEGGKLDNFSDVDGDLPGLAIIDLNLQGGTLWQTGDNGAQWTRVESASDQDPLLMLADSKTRVYYQPAAGFSGSIEDILTIRAWDRNPAGPISELGDGIDGVASGDQSGIGVALSQDGLTMAVGARYHDSEKNDAGQVRIYRWSGNEWIQLGSDIYGEGANDQLGEALSFSADGLRLAIGAHRNDDQGSDAGHARVYEWDGTEWIQLGQDLDGQAANDWYGVDVDLSHNGMTLAVGARDGGDSSGGYTDVYRWNGESWQPMGQRLMGQSSGGRFGQSVSISETGTTIAIGAEFSNANGSQSGEARIYNWDGQQWQQMGATLVGESPGDKFGHKVSISGNGDVVAVGAHYDDAAGPDAGHTRVFEWSGVEWIQRGNDIDGEAAGDKSGYNVSLSDDGNRVAISARFNDGNGQDSGHARIFQWDGLAWVQMGDDIDGEGPGEQIWRLELSGDGSKVVIGAYNNDRAGNNAGVTRVYSISSIPFESTLSTNTDTVAIDVFSIDPLGPVDSFRDEGVTVDGERWYQGSTSQTGRLTMLAQFDADSSNGELEIELLDAQKQLIATATPVASGLRIDYTADVGETFYLKLIGNQTDIDLRILNLLKAVGDTITVAGTDSADDYSLTTGANHRLVVNGIDYTFSGDDYDAFNIDGAAGADSIWIGGTSDAESIELRMADTQITGAGYTVQALNIGDVVFAGRGGADTANFYDTNTADTFISSPSWAKMVGSSYSHIVRGLPAVTAHATVGYDLAYMNDSAGDDTYETFSERVVMTSDTHVVTAIGFKRSSGTSSGGNDTATAHDSAGNDRLLSYEDRIILYDGTHTHTSIDFTTNQVFASGQAGDVAYMFDSAGDDQMVARPESTVITQSDRETTAHGFAQSFAYASTGNDTAEFHDTSGDNDYNGYLDRAVMKGDGIFLWGRGFDQMTGHFSSGSDRALMFDSEGDDTYVSGASDTTMSNESASNRVVGYTSIYAYSDGGTDTATLHDTASQETFRAYPDKAVLHGDDMFSWTRGFSRVTAHSSGGTDEAQFYDSASDDTFRSEGALVQMAGDGYLNLAQGFLKNSGYSSGGSDTALMFDTSGDDLYRTYPTEAVMIGSGVTNAAYDFENTQGFSNAGTDSARLFDSADDDLLMSYADRATLSGDGWANEVVGFYLNTVYGSGGYDQATMEDSTGDDLVKVRTIGPRLTQGDGTVFDVRTFDRILARSVNGGEDIAELLDVDYEFELEGDWNS